MIKILFIERKFWVNAGIEKVFRQIAKTLSTDRFESAFQTAKYGNTFSGMLRNFLFFKREKADIYHITGQIHYIALLLPVEKTVLTVHDLIFLHNRRGLRRYFLKKILLDLPIKRLRYVTAISQATKDEIIEHTGCPDEKVRVIENPMFEGFADTSPGKFNKENPLILHIGTAENKNIERLVESLEVISCRLRIIGKVEDAILSRIAKLGIEFEYAVGLDEKQMIEEYKKADIVSFCSTYEGFGLPIIEAQALKTPVVTSNIEPMKSVSGGAACLVDPFEVSSIRAGILKVINEDDYRNTLIQNGLDNISRFNPGAIARQYEELYEEILK